VGEGAEGQKYKIKPLGLDLGAPSEMEVESSEGRWHGGADEVVVVVGHCIHKCEAGESVCAKKPKPSRHGLILGAPCETVKGDSGEGWCGGVYEVVAVVGLCARETRGREGVWAKTRNRAVVARFRARRVKRRQGMVHRGGVVVCVRWWWWWRGCALAKREPGRGVGPKPETERTCSVSGMSCKMTVQEGGEGWWQPPPW